MSFNDPEDVLLVKCFGKWWIDDQSIYEEPPKIHFNLASQADIIYYIVNKQVIKNRYKEPFEDSVLIRYWTDPTSFPEVHGEEWVDAYLNYVGELGKKAGENLGKELRTK